MKRNRESLHMLLKKYCKNVYFQPPEKHKLEYPCIIYRVDDIEENTANNRKYIRNKKYSLTVCTKNPESEIVDNILEDEDLIRSEYINSFISSTLYNTVIDIYY